MRGFTVRSKTKRGTLKQIVKEKKGTAGSATLNPNHAMGLSLLYRRLPSVLYHHIATGQHNDDGSKALWEHLDSLEWNGIEDRKEIVNLQKAQKMSLTLGHEF